MTRPRLGTNDAAMDDKVQPSEDAYGERRSSEIRLRIERLNSLIDGHQASMELAGFGAAAIEPLRRFLFAGRPSGIFQPRQWAVEALAAIGAKDVLVAYLARDEWIADPVIRQGEDAVRNTAARLVSRWRSDDVFELLLSLAQKRLLPGVIAALGTFGRPEALPVLERALEDDVARPAAEEALPAFGSRAVDTLIASVGRKQMNEDEEVPSSLRRRRAAAEILANTELEETHWVRLKLLLELVVRAAKIAATLGSDPDKKLAVTALLRVLPESPWYVRDEAAQCLGSLYGVAEPVVDDEIARRNKMAPLKRATDDTLLLLVRLRQHVKDRR
jgi:HEAT repeat protein